MHSIHVSLEDKTQPRPPSVGETATPAEPLTEDRTSPSGRQVFRSVGREMTDTELSSPAAVKLLLDMLDQAEASRDEYKSFVDRFYQADKRAALAEEKQRGNKALDICFGVGTALGGILAGASQSFWARTPPETVTGNTLFGVGALMILGFGAALFYRK